MTRRYVMRPAVSHLLTLFLLIFCCSTRATASNIFSDSFDSYPSGFSATALGSVWTVVQGTTSYNGSTYTGTVDVMGANAFPNTICVAAGGGDQCVDLVGSSPNPGAGARLETVQ